jgi:two-component system, cell cycle response regulator
VAQTLPTIQLPRDTAMVEVTAPAPASDPQASLVRIYPAGVSGSLIPLAGDRNSIGRDAICDVELMDDFISREHAIITLQGGHFYLQDCGSLNGTFINDVRVKEIQRLVPGDAIRLGNHIFKFLSADHIEAQYHEAVYEMMTLDGLTGAYNKRFFEDAIEREILRSQRHWRPLSLLLFDIDHFKAVNDHYGHLAGDECLKQLVARVRSRIRGEDLLARFGGEEFALALSETTLKQAVQIARDLRQQVENEPFPTSRGPVPLTISIGVGIANGQMAVSSKELIETADDNLYRAKHQGRNCVCF